MAPDTIPARTTNLLTLYIVALVSIATLVIGAIVWVEYMNAAQDNTALIVIIIGFGVTLLATVPPILATQAKAQESVMTAKKTEKAVDGKMKEFEEVLRELMREQGDKIRAEGQAEVAVAVARSEAAAALAEGQIAGAEAANKRTDDLAARPVAQSLGPVVITNGPKPVEVKLVEGHEVGKELIKPPGTTKP